MTKTEMPAIVGEAISQVCHDEERLAALYRYGVLDTPAEAAFDDIASLVAHICQAPIAVINFIDKSRQWFKSEIGLGVRETPLDVSLCVHALLQDDLFVVHDTLEDDRFRNNPLVAGKPQLRFYAGALLSTPKGIPLGTLCVLDYVPRTLSPEQLDALRALSRQVMSQLELRRMVMEQQQQLEAQLKRDLTLRQALDAAESANRAKDRFMAMLSHELRTPLSPALMTATALADDELLPKGIRDDARLIERNLELETRLIDDLLDVTRIVTGKLQLHLEQIDLHSAIKHAVAMCSTDADKKGISISLKLEARQNELKGDWPKLVQVFCNLIKNAIKFTPSGGRITVSSKNTMPEILQVTVADTGIGVAPHLLPRLFDPFEQGGGNVTREYGGLGLGLAISKGIVQAHGGTIVANSAGKDRGTQFTAEFGVTAPKIKSLPHSDLGGSRDGKPQLTILLVEDHADTLRAMSRLLSKLKHRVVTADCVAGALKAATENEFDVVISDLGLPDGTGLDLMRELLSQKPIRGIALTGYGMEADIEKTREAGFARHLTKPIHFPDLEEAIREIAVS